MCGRYMITSSFEAMARLFGATLAELGPDVARPNVSPTETIPVCVSHEGDRALVPMRWGLLPPWYRAPNGGPLLINARAEDIATKPAFREAIRARRCLIPADGFYEWQGEKGAKVPWVVRPRDGGPARLRRALAGRGAASTPAPSSPARPTRCSRRSTTGCRW